MKNAASRPTVLVLLLASLALAPIAGAADKTETSVVRGRVTGPDEKAVAGAVVRLVPSREDDEAARRRARRGLPSKPVVVKTGEDGSFEAKGLDGTKFDARVEAKGFAPSVNEGIPAGASLRVRLKSGIPLAGSVVDLGSRRAVPGASIRVFDSGAARFGDEAAIAATADENGRFVVPDLPVGKARLEAWAPGKAKAVLDDVVVAPEKEGEAKKPDPIVYLRPGASVAGRVVDPAGKPVAEADVQLVPSGGMFAFWRSGAGRPDTTDESGKFAFEGAPAGSKFRVAASKEGYARKESAEFTVEAGRDRADLEIRLEATATLVFRMLDADERPVTDVAVTPERSDEREGRRGRFGFGAIAEDRIEKGEDGTITVRGLDPGRFDLSIEPWGYDPIEREDVRLTAGQTTDLGTLRAREGVGIAGRVLDPEGATIADATVSGVWMDGDRPSFRSVRTKKDGTWKLSGIGDRPARQLTARAKGFSAAEKQGAMPGDRNVDFTLERAAAIVGKVLLPDGSAPPAFRVKAHEEAGARRDQTFMMRRVGFGRDEETFSDPSGHFRLEGVDPGKVTIEATADGWAPARKKGVEAVAGRDAEVGTLVLDPGRTLRGRVLDARDDSPLPGAIVSLATPQGPMRFRFGDSEGPAAMTDLGGAFTISGLETRTYAASVQHPDFAPGQASVEVPADRDPADLLVRLSRGGTLTGTVRDASKAPVEGASIVAMLGMMEGEPRDAMTGPDGVYKFERLAPGTYGVIRAPGRGRIVLGMGMKQAVVRDGETTVLDFDEKAAITLRGRVLRGGKSVPGAVLVFAQGAGAFPMGTVKTTQSNADGGYEIGLDAAGEYTVIVQTDGAFRGGAPVRIQVPDEPEPVRDVVVSVGGIAGRVVDSSGKPLPGVMVSARRDGASPNDPTAGSGSGTRPDGTFSIESIAPGTYRVTASAQGFRTAEEYPVLVSDEAATPPLEIRLEPGRDLRGRVVDPSGGGIAGALVVAAPAGSLERTAIPASTDVNGAFVLTAPSDGAVDVAAFARGYAPARASGVDPASSEPVLVVGQGGRLRMTVLDRDGKPLPGVSVTAAASPPFLGSDLALFLGRPAPTGPDGTTTAGPLAPGGYEISVRLGARTATATVAVPDGGEAAITITLP